MERNQTHYLIPGGTHAALVGIVLLLLASSAWGDPSAFEPRHGVFDQGGGVVLIGSLGSWISVGQPSPTGRCGEEGFQNSGGFVYSLRPHIGISAQDIGFGEVQVGESSEQRLTITNEGIGIPLVVVSLAVSPDVFTMASPQELPITILPGDAVDAVVEFAPIAGGEALGNLVLVSTDPFMPEISIGLSGAGVTQPVADISVSVANLDFGEVLIGSEAVRHFSITNAGTATLIVDSLAAGHPDIHIVEPAFPQTLEPSGQVEVAVRFSPRSEMVLTDTLRIYSSDGDEPVVSISLRGSGVVDTFADIALSAGRIDFGSVQVGTEATRQFSILNEGTAGLRVDSLVVGDPSVAVTSPSFPQVIAPAGEIAVAVVYMPTAVAQLVDTLRVFSADVDEPVVAVTLSGRGVAEPVADLFLALDSIDFGTVQVGSSRDTVFTVMSAGSADLVIDSLISDSGVFAVLDPEFPQTVEPEGLIEVALRFQPDGAGPVAGVLTIFSNDPDEPQTTLDVSGTGSTGDMTAPTIVHTPVHTAVRGTAIEINATITDLQSAIAGATLYYRRGGEASFSEVNMTAGGADGYSGVIPGEWVTERGVAYHIAARDASANEATTNPSQVAVSATDLVSTQAVPAASYRMISTPIQPSDGSPQVVLVDDYGAYDTTRWRLGKWNPSASGYHEYTVNWNSSTDDFAPGRGYWLIVRDGGSFDISGTSVSFASSHAMTLQPGWNQIADPFAFAVNWGTIPKDAAISDSLWEYSGSGYGITTTLQPWRGYWVENRGTAAVQVDVPAEEADGASLAPARVDDGIVWELAIEALGDGFSDVVNRLGVAATALEGRDSFDVREPPPPWEYVWLYFSQEDGAPYATDYRPVFDDGASWSFTVATAGVEGEVALNFAGILAIPAEFSVVLLDEHDGQVIDLRQTSMHRYVAGATSDVKCFHLVVGVPGYVDQEMDRLLPVPDVFHLAQNFPNPMSDQTEIRFQVPKTDGRQIQRVIIGVYDGLGRQVATVLNEQRGPGFYAVRWDGRGAQGRLVPNGLYVYRMEAQGGWCQSRRLVVLR